MRSLFYLASALLAALLAQAASSLGDRLLVILDDVAEKEGYSKFLGDLQDRGFRISYETPKSESLSLFHLGERAYDHVLLLPSKSKGLGPNLTANVLLQFINAQGNILLTLSSSTATPTSIVALLGELDISLPAERTGLVVDHFNYDAASAAEKHDVLLLAPQPPAREGVRPFFVPDEAGSEQLVAFPRGVGFTLGGGELLAPVLRAPRTAYSYNAKEQGEALDPEELFAAGEQLSLVSVMQARNSARFAVVGSADMLSDKWFGAKVKTVDGKKGESWNREFARRLSGWAFGEIGVLRVNEIEHHLDDPTVTNASNPSIYRIKNDVTYTVSISEYSWDKWIPLTVPADDDLQLEFSMLSPFQRLKLNAKSTEEQATTYSVTFTLPDQHGIFNFMLDYKRPFLSNVEEKRTVSVRHMAHDEWPRSFVISAAWPWITGIFSTIAGFVAFSALWMYNQPVGSASQSKKKQ